MICDQREPGCGQCDKRQQQCPGYRNLVDLMFRDESSHVIKKAKAKARRKGGASPDPGASPPESASCSTTAVTPEPHQRQDGSHLHQQLLLPQYSLEQGPAHVHERQRRRKTAPTLSLPTPASRRLEGQPHPPRHEESGSLLPSPSAGSRPKTPKIAVWYTLNPTCQERGTAYFFSRYVATDENACHQRFDFIYEIWKPGAEMPEHQVDSVLASMTAVGLVGLANMTRSRDAMENARKSYGTALRLINAALKVPREAVRDTTMLSILILGLFEMTAADANPRTMKAWQEHVNGAAALARLRGPAQFRTRAGAKMFMMLCQSVMICCLQTEQPMPTSLVELRGELVRQQRSCGDCNGLGDCGKCGITGINGSEACNSAGNVDDGHGRNGRSNGAGLTAWKTNSSHASVAPEDSIEIAMPIYRVLQFRNDFRSGHFGEREAMVDRLMEMDDEFDRAAKSLPESWRYRTLHMPRPHKAVFGDRCHVYPSIGKAAVWNGIRACRLLILETMLGELHAICSNLTDPALVPRRFSDGFLAARRSLESMCLAILSSVPQHSGLLAPPHGLHPASVSGAISTVEVRAPATPPQSPESTTSSSSPSESSLGCGGLSDDRASATACVTDDGGPTLLDPTRAKNPHEEAQRYMLLASASNTIIWPLYQVGMSSICSADMRAYCVERLEAIYKETGLGQASAIAALVRSRRVVPRWKQLERLLIPDVNDSP